MREGWSVPGAMQAVVVSYNMIAIDIKHFQRMRWEFMVLDEAHLIRNFKG